MGWGCNIVGWEGSWGVLVIWGGDDDGAQSMCVYVVCTSVCVECVYVV